jgi:hypothetical protein
MRGQAFLERSRIFKQIENEMLYQEYETIVKAEYFHQKVNPENL